MRRLYALRDATHANVLVEIDSMDSRRIFAKQLLFASWLVMKIVLGASSNDGEADIVSGCGFQPQYLHVNFRVTLRLEAAATILKTLS